MTNEISQQIANNISTQEENVGIGQNLSIPTSLNQSVILDTSTKEQQQQQINVVNDATLQAALSSMNETQIQHFLDELQKTGKAFLPSIGQTIELLTVPTIQQQQNEILLEDLTSIFQSSNNDVEPKIFQQSVDIKSNIQYRDTSARQTRTANTYGGTSVTSTTRPGTAVKSTISSSGCATTRTSIQQQTNNEDRMFFGRPTTIGQGQYHNRTGLISNKPDYQITSPFVRTQQQRRTISWLHNRSRRHSSGDDADSDRDMSPPSCSMNSNDSLGPTRRSARVPKPKQDADFVTFPLLDRDEQGNPILPTPSSIPLHKDEDDEDDIPYRLMDYPRLTQQSQLSTMNSTSTSIDSTRRVRTVAEMRSISSTNRKQPRWPDHELYHVKSFVPLIMPQQMTNPSTVKNKMIMCKPLTCECEVEAKPTRCTIATQTEMENMIPDVPLVTLPVPIYLPSPTPSYRLFKPRAVPIPVPVFVPIMIPVRKTSYKNIRAYLQSQRDLLPDDPCQAALILHAESLVRAENQPHGTTINHIQDSMIMMDTTRNDSYLTPLHIIDNLPELDLEAHYINMVASNDCEIEKLLQMLPDAELQLKWTYGVQAFQQWCAHRNRPILYPSNHFTPEEVTIAKQYLVKSDLLLYSNGDELQHVMSVFIQEVRRPTGDPYLPESLYYLCLGIQFYLNLNNHHIDLFDPRYSVFNSTLNKILFNYSPRILAESNIHVSLINESILYEAHSLGILTPWSLLTTLIYTNTKYFNLKTVEAHKAISFANFGKYSQWERLSNNSPQGQQINYLRYYANSPDLKSLADSPTVYEITEQINGPVRCPIKQYDFYVSKCPEEVRGTADIFYLTPISGQSLDSPIWFSKEQLSETIINQILNRLKLLPDFYNQTQPVEINSSTTGYNSTLSTDMN